MTTRSFTLNLLQSRRIKKSQLGIMFWQDMLLACLHSSIVELVTVRLIVSLEFLGDLTRVSHSPGMQATQGHITHS